MKDIDRAEFSILIAGIHAYHRQPISDAIISVWWNGCKKWGLEEITKALDILTSDAEAGKFPPKIGDITRVLAGTTTDRAALAWGKVLQAMSSVGAYSDVVFDDAAIHAAIEDCGGWVKICRSQTEELSYLQHRFCQSHKAYTGRGVFEYQRRLMGDRSPDLEFEKRGMKPPKPAIVGNIEQARLVYRGGEVGGKTQISYSPLDVLSQTLLGGA